MNREKVLELAREADLYMTSDERIAAVERFAALIEREVREVAGAEQAPMQCWDGEGNAEVLRPKGGLMINPEAQPQDCHTTFIGTDATEVLRISKEGVWANPDVPVNETVKAVLSVLDKRIKKMVEEAVAEVRGDAEPVAFEFQHEDTGLIDFVDPQQVEWGFQKNNPRWQLIGPVFRHPAPAVVRQLVDVLNIAEDYIVEALSKHDEAYDDHPAMKADRDLIVQDLEQLKAALAVAKEAGL